MEIKVRKIVCQFVFDGKDVVEKIFNLLILRYRAKFSFHVGKEQPLTTLAHLTLKIKNKETDCQKGNTD